MKALDAFTSKLGLSSEAFRDLCKLKWSFNIKPDLVVMLPGCPPVCIEAKLESREGVYPTRTEECGIFDRRFGLRQGRVRQFELQVFMFQDLLVNPCQPVVVARDLGEGKGEAEATGRQTPIFRWTEVFATLETDKSLPFVAKLINENQTLRENPGRGCDLHGAGR